MHALRSGISIAVVISIVVLAGIVVWILVDPYFSGTVRLAAIDLRLSSNPRV